MEKWEIALQKFLKNWKKKKEVIGAIACGSYVLGNPSKKSDVDVHIILDSKTPWRERGNKIIDGILIEYFANPLKKHYEYAKEDYKQRRMITAHMFCTGKVIFDKTGELKKLIKDLKKEISKKFPKQSKIQIELAKYLLWDMLDNLEEVFESNGKEFFFVYYNHLNSLFESYAKFLQFEFIPVHKLRRFLTDEKDKKKYDVSDFPDKEFVKMYANAIDIKDKSKMIKEYQTITNYVFDKMGGFNIDGWKLKSPAK